jgi:hypothetical protein
LFYLENVASRQSKEFLFYVMPFDNNNNNPENKIDVDMSIFKEDDSPQQQINEQSLTQDLEKNRECKSNITK